MRSRWLDGGQVLFCIFMDQDKVTKMPKKKKRPTFTHLDNTSLVNKGFMLWPNSKLFLEGPTEEIPQVQGACVGCQSEDKIHFILPACRFSYIIMFLDGKP